MPEARPVPPISDTMREHARVQPDSWLYVLDPTADPDGAVPPELVVGAFPVDSAGVLGEDFEHNPLYVPGGAPAPTDPLDAALQELTAGRGSREAVLALLRTAELLLHEGPDDGFVVVATPVGRDVVQAWTAPEHATQVPGLGVSGLGVSGLVLRRGRELARSLPAGVDLELNPGSAAGVRVPSESLLR